MKAKAIHALAALALMLALPALAQPEWTYEETVDDFSGRASASATSPPVRRGPYNTISKLVVRCRGGYQLENLMSFSYLNRPGDDGAPVMARVTMPDYLQALGAPKAPVPLHVNESTSGKGLFIREPPFSFAQMLMLGDSFAVRFDYYGHGTVTFDYTLAGALDPIAKVRRACLNIAPDKKGKWRGQWLTGSIWTGSKSMKKGTPFTPVLDPHANYLAAHDECHANNRKKKARSECLSALNYNEATGGWHHFQ